MARERTRKSAQPARARHDYVGLDRVLHEKARLGILIALLNRKEGVPFLELRTLCELTDGNLARHLQVLQESEVVEIEKTSDGARPRTVVRLSKTGRKQFLAYLEELDRVLKDARIAAQASSGARASARHGYSPA